MIPFVDVIRSLYATMIRYIISALACVKTQNIKELYSIPSWEEQYIGLSLSVSSKL